MGHAVVLTGAVRDEATSFHYRPAGRVVPADPGPAEILAGALSAGGAPYPHATGPLGAWPCRVPKLCHGV